MHTHSPLNTAGFAHPRKNVGILRIHPGMRVADFGSGSGAYVLAIGEQLEGTGHIYAVDIQKDLLRRIHNDAHKRGYKNVSVVWADLENPNGSKLAAGTLDTVVISNLLFQVENKLAVLKEAHRVLKPGGQVALIDWTESFGGMGPQKRDVVTKEAGQALATDAGFEVAQEFPAGAHHWGLILKIAKT